MSKRFNTIDGETLMSQPMEPIQFVVDGLLSQGVHILAGAPKCGKSWLALWLSVTVAKGEPVWGNRVKQGVTLYLCFEDSRLRIQNRLIDITEDAPPDVHFCEEACRLGEGLEERIANFVADHPGTVLVIIDTLQMIRRPAKDNSYANDYDDLSTIKRLADQNGLAILLIHHLRKQDDADPFNRISGTAGLSGAVDGSFTLIEDKRGSGHATLNCIGRDIEYRELELKRGPDNIWKLVRDSREEPEMLLDTVVPLAEAFMQERSTYCGTPSELAEALSRLGGEPLSPKVLSRRLLQNTEALERCGLRVAGRRSNGKRLIHLSRIPGDSDDSADETGSASTLFSDDPVDPAG